MKYLKSITKYSLGLLAFYTIIHFTEKSDLRELQTHQRMMNLPEYSTRFQQKGTNDLTHQQELEMIVRNAGFP